MTKFNKRNFLKTFALLASASLLGSCNRNDEKINDISGNKFPSIKLKMATSFPRNLPGADIPAQRLAKKIKKMSQGKIDILHYAAGEIVPAFEVFDAVREKIVDCAYTAPQYWISKHKAIPFFCCIPGGMTSKEIFVWLTEGKGQNLWDELYKKFNLKGFPAGDTGTTMGGWFNKKINSVQDFKGLKMRMPGLGAEVINRMGAISVNLSGGEVINSLKLGVLDAAEWAGPWPDMTMGFHKVAKYYYGPGIHEPSTLCEFMINNELWNSFPLEYKEIIKNASYANYIEVVSEYFYKNAKTLAILRNKYGIKIAQYTSEIIEEFFKHSKAIVKENAENDLIYKKIYEDWRKNISIFNSYHKFSDNEYLKLRLKFT
ncbi:MAG: Monocarboxylate 2-oxoacid-binding periplasmic protein [Alphaproteobacteria bacterium MarineAlpha9_Bin4]|nr:ABC transporter substrate-binding protein [Pelagibacterales bacterium]PPR26543.1 MAG: Monocarboxylate 2-oxoacid-binding periplasmic protein [Alphaproteobacteria bacterium MarineAlpha9_Bin4]|tara:strand:+ start:1940 stop:3058 length:1119 start_codon:yes stop_codon:yes gene_type:complete